MTLAAGVSDVLSETGFPLCRLGVRESFLAPGSVLYIQNETPEDCFVVLQGWLALRVERPGENPLILDFALPGDVLGFGWRPGSPANHSARCLTPAKVCVIPRARLEARMAQDATLAARVLDYMTTTDEHMFDHLVSISGRSARERIARLLADLAIRSRRSAPFGDGRVILLPLRLREIAEATGLTNVHVSRTLRALWQSGVLRYSHGKLEILDREALAKLAPLSPTG